MYRNIIALMAVCLFLITLGTCYGVETTLGIGQDVPVDSWQSEGLRCSVIQVEVSKQFKSPWYGSIVFDVLWGKLNSPQVIDGTYFSGSVSGLAVSARLGIQKRIVSSLYGKLFGGFGVLSAHLPEIGDSGMVGHFGAGLKYNMAKFTLGYEIVHFSDPLQSGDKGWNFQIISIGYQF